MEEIGPENEGIVTLSYSELERRWHIANDSGKLAGSVHLIVTRGAAAAVPKGQDKVSTPMHQVPQRVRFSVAAGVEGDRWKAGVDIESQVSLTSLAVTRLVAGAADRYHLCGNNFIVDLDLSAQAMPAGTRLKLGSGVIEISGMPHLPCERYSARFGTAASEWAGDTRHAERHLRGRYARVISDGEVALGDAICILDS